MIAETARRRPSRCALSRWRRRKKYAHRLAVVELAISREFTLIASLLIDRRLIVLEAAA